MSDIAHLTVETVSGVTIFKVRGALKLGEPALDELRRRCCELATRNIARLGLDLEQVPAIDSSGIGVLLQAYTTLRNRGGQCKLMNVARMPAEVLRVVGLLSLFEVTKIAMLFWPALAAQLDSAVHSSKKIPLPTFFHSGYYAGTSPGANG